MAATLVDTLIRFQRTGYKPKRTVKIALTCGEETNGAFNGVEWLAANKRDLIDAEFALNEGGGGTSDGKGKVVEQAMQVGEKTFATYRLETRNPGGHSSVPRPDNAIYQLARALVRIEAHEFPLEMSETTRTYFREAGAGRKDETGAAMVALAANPADKAAEAIANKDPFLHSNLRTTCVATMLDGGHARNALAQRAGAYVNCRIFPGHSVEEIRTELARVVGRSGGDGDRPCRRCGQARRRPRSIRRSWTQPRNWRRNTSPGCRSCRPCRTATPTRPFWLPPASRPTECPGAWADPDGNGAHGLNERIEVRSLFVGRDYLFDLIKAYAD